MRWLAVVPVAVLAIAVSACGSSSGGGGDTVTTADTAVQADVVEATDPGKGDPAPTDTTPVDPGKETAKPDVSSEAVVLPDVPIQPQCPTVFTGSTCLEAIACVVQCDDATYQGQCLGQADQGLKDKVAAITKCLKDAQCDSAFDDNELSDCAETSCGELFSACFAGTAKCKDIWACRRDCNADDHGCPMKCFGQGTSDAQEIWITYKDCIEQDECTSTDLQPNGWPTEDCERNAANHYCPNQHSACIPPQ